MYVSHSHHPLSERGTTAEISLPCVRGGGLRQQLGGVVVGGLQLGGVVPLCKGRLCSIPQSATLTAPFAQGSL